MYELLVWKRRVQPAAATPSSCLLRCSIRVQHRGVRPRDWPPWEPLQDPVVGGPFGLILQLLLHGGDVLRARVEKPVGGRFLLLRCDVWGNLLRKNPESDDTEFGQGDVTQRVACLRFP